MAIQPLVSIIVPTYNSADNLRRFLESFSASHLKEYEIIVNDDSRTKDSTAVVVANARRKGICVEMIKENRMMAQARKAGATHARGMYLFHLGSDMEITPGLLQECVEKMKVGFDALVIPEESFGTTFWARCKWIEKKCYEGVEQMESLRFVRKDIYEKLGGHDERMVFSEDKDFDLRVREAGYKIGRTNAKLRHNEGALCLMNTLRKKFKYSGTANIFAEKHPEHFKWQANIFSRYMVYLKNIKYLFSSPFLYLGVFVMKTMEFLVGGIGYLKNTVSESTKRDLVRYRFKPENISIISEGIEIGQVESLEEQVSAYPRVSIIIACKNNAQYIRAALQSVVAQTYKNIEVIVVDNFSTDGTFEIAKQYTPNVYQLGPERSTQFNYGFKKSTGELIYRIGAEFVLEEDVVEKCVKKIHEGYDALALHNRSVGDSIWAKVRYIERESYYQDQSIVAVRFMKRGVFETVGMFDESLVAGEDFDLHNRIVKAGFKWALFSARVLRSFIAESKMPATGTMAK